MTKQTKGIIAQIEHNGEKNIVNQLIENFTSEDDTGKINTTKHDAKIS